MTTRTVTILGMVALFAGLALAADASAGPCTAECFNDPPPSCDQYCASGDKGEQCTFAQQGGCTFCNWYGVCDPMEEDDFAALDISPAGTLSLTGATNASITKGNRIVSGCSSLVQTHVDYVSSPSPDIGVITI